MKAALDLILSINSYHYHDCYYERYVRLRAANLPLCLIDLLTRAADYHEQPTFFASRHPQIYTRTLSNIFYLLSLILACTSTCLGYSLSQTWFNTFAKP